MSKVLGHLRNLAVPFAALLGVLGVAFGLFVAFWGWAHFKADFIPLDSSRVGPNLCASLFLVVLVIAHNEFVVIERDEKARKDHHQQIKDTMRELLHPMDQAESDIAEQVEEQWRQKVLAQLDETTPGGIGTVAAKLAELTPKE